MDPKECLRIADQAVSDLDFITARISLAEYWHWRAKGGFEPVEVAGTLKRGDDFARDTRRRLDDAQGARPVTYSVNIDEAPMSWSREGFTSLEGARLFAIDEAKRIEASDAQPGDDFGQIYCEDTIGNSWNLIEENGLYSWQQAEIAPPIAELLPQIKEINASVLS